RGNRDHIAQTGGRGGLPGSIPPPPGHSAIAPERQAMSSASRNRHSVCQVSRNGILAPRTIAPNRDGAGKSDGAETQKQAEAKRQSNELLHENGLPRDKVY